MSEISDIFLCKTPRKKNMSLENVFGVWSFEEYK